MARGGGAARQWASRRCWKGGRACSRLEYACHSPRQKRWFVLHVTPLTHDQGGAVVSHINITDRVLSEQKLVFLATHDALTGLYNRAFFDQELARLQRTVGEANRRPGERGDGRRRRLEAGQRPAWGTPRATSCCAGRRRC